MTMMISSHYLQLEFRSRTHCPPFQGIGVLENPKSIASFSPLLSFIFCSNSSTVFCRGLHRSQYPRCLAGVSQNKATSEFNVSTAASLGLPTASEVIRDFYDGINRRDLESVELLIGVECVYEDLIFSKPFVGRKATMEFFKRFTESISSELQFVIDEISSEDTSSAGVTWHLEWRGRPFPFSKGCSFYRLEQSEGTRKIIFVAGKGRPDSRICITCTFVKDRCSGRIIETAKQVVRHYFFQGKTIFDKLCTRLCRTCRETWGSSIGYHWYCYLAAATVSAAC